MTAFNHEFIVRFADIDHAGIVYYPRFYHYFHVGFEELLRDRLGPKGYLDLLDVRRIGLPSVHSTCQHVSPLRFADTASVQVQLERLGTKSVTLAYEVCRVHEEGRTLAASGTVTCCATDLDRFQSIEMPEDLRALFLELSAPVS